MPAFVHIHDKTFVPYLSESKIKEAIQSLANSINNDYTAAHHYTSMAYLEIDQLDNARIHRDQLDLICLFGCIDFTEVDNAIKMYEKNNGR